MNIFVVDEDPRVCAEWLDDKRVIKMILESAQMLSTAIIAHQYPQFFGKLNKEQRKERDRVVRKIGVYKPFNPNHKVNIWVRKTRGNYFWLLRHFLELCNEYEFRFGKQHRCRKKFNKFLTYMNVVPKGKRTEFINYAKRESMGIDYTCEKNVHDAYKLYLNERWEKDSRRPKWYGV